MLRPAFLPLLLLVLSFHSAASAQDACPSAIGSQGSYAIDRNGFPTEVSYDNTPVVRALLKQGSRILQETTFHEGLFQLEQIYRGKRTVHTPKSDLDKAFPLKLRQKVAFLFETASGDSRYVTTVTLEATGSDRLSLGRCTYDVVKIARDETHGDSKRPQVVEYYSPELRFVIAKEHKERDGRLTLIKFDRITALP